MTRRRAKQRRMKAAFGWKYHGPRMTYDFSSLAKMAVRTLRRLRAAVIKAAEEVAPVIARMARQRAEMQVKAYAALGESITLMAARKLDSDDTA